MTRVYIAAPYTELSLALTVAVILRKAGFGMTSRWVTAATEDTSRWAQNDLEDLDKSDVLVALNRRAWRDAPEKNSGGRHVEFGYALAKGKPIVLVGEATNIFHLHPSVIRTPFDDNNLPNVPLLLEALAHAC